MSAHTAFTLNETPDQFESRIRVRFPVGSSESDLVAELRREHFKIRAAAALDRPNPEGMTFEAIYNGSLGIACAIDWKVAWRADAGRIAVIHAAYGDTCL